MLYVSVYFTAACGTAPACSSEDVSLDGIGGLLTDGKRKLRQERDGIYTLGEDVNVSAV